MNLINLIEVSGTYIFSAGKGILVCLVSVGFIFLLGRSFLPSFIGPKEGRDEYTCLFGFALYLAVCWAGIRFGVPILLVLSGLACGILLMGSLGILRRKEKTAIEFFFEIKNYREFVFLFATYYTISYIFLPSNFFGKELPINSTIYNNDLLHYIDVSSYLQRLGLQNITSHDYLSASYWVTPSAHYVFDLLALGFGGDVMSATMPLIYGIVSVTGYAISRLAREVFRVSFGTSALYGALVISGVFFQYVYGNGFIPQFVASAILLLGVLQTVICLQKESAPNWLSFASILFITIFIIFYTYLAMLLAYLICEVLVILAFVLMDDRGCPEDSVRAQRTIEEKIRRLAWFAGAFIVSIALVFAFDPSHTRDIFITYIPILANVDAGWPLDLLPIYALAGMPGPMQLSPYWGHVWLGIALIVTALVGYLHVYKKIGVENSAQRAFVLIGVFGSLAYIAYFIKIGPVYRQWKFAAYFPLLWLWTWYPVAGRLIASLPFRGKGASSNFLQKMNWLVVLFFGTAIFTNFLIHFTIYSRARAGAGLSSRFHADYANLAAIDALGGFDELYVYMNGFSATFMPPYFIRHKRLHLLSASYYAVEGYDPEKITVRSPLFLESEECDPSISVSIIGVGCLFSSAPTLKLDKVYSLSSKSVGSFFLSTEGLSNPEPWGTWADKETAKISVLAFKGDIDLCEPCYLNLRVQPYLPNGRKGQRIVFNIGPKFFGDVQVSETGWVSIPYRRTDWSGSKSAMLNVGMKFLDRTSPHEVDSQNPDVRKLGMGFLSFSLTSQPLGDVPDEKATGVQ